MHYQLTVNAKIALADILHYIAEDNKAAAVPVKRNFFDSCKLLATMPGMGWHPEFAADAGLLCFPVKKYHQYLIVYRKRKKGIVIVDVVHGARDLPALFDNK